jgi:hypothetical protein
MKVQHLGGGWAVTLAGAVGLAGGAATSRAGVTASQYTASDFTGSPVVQTTPVGGTTGAANTTAGFYWLQRTNTNVATQEASDIVAQTITPSSTFTLGRIDVLLSGSRLSDISLHIFAPVQAGGTNTDGFVTPGASAVDLLNPTNDASTEQKFTVFGGAGQYFVSLALDGAQQVTLQAGTKYDIEFWSDGARNALDYPPNPFTSDSPQVWFQQTAAGAGTFAGGNTYQNKNGSAGYAGIGNFRGNDGNTGRDIAIALYAVPEPSSLAVVGVAAAAGLLSRRRRRAALVEP